MLVLFPLFGPVCRGFLQKQKGFQCWYCSHYLLLFNVLPIFFVFVCLFVIPSGLYYLCCSHVLEKKISYLSYTPEKEHGKQLSVSLIFGKLKSKNSKQTIEMVLMDHTVIVVFFFIVVITHSYFLQYCLTSSISSSGTVISFFFFQVCIWFLCFYPF